LSARQKKIQSLTASIATAENKSAEKTIKSQIEEVKSEENALANEIEKLKNLK
jgi:hypothetical protein